ncbi:MAG: UDP-N-acetylmuramoyl-L-alanyl-D-glutamate--2,6-diaminopimelate ligase [Bacillota bacterium]|nr:UDP-N-acetylmuramoyl-L-alanyl-D-glutamate--2,6-diaminopimelate ligase [Bacillota bacterium]
MKLSNLLANIEFELIREGAKGLDTEVEEIILDSRKAEPGCLFVCIKGAVADGHRFAPDVADKGAAVIVVQDAEAAGDIGEGPVIVKVTDSRYALACISAAWFGHPAEKLKTIGITGTKGKTTTTYMVKSILEKVGHKVGLIGTIEAVIGDKSIPAANTTPESYLVQKYFREMVDAGCDCVVMEASSQGFMLHRTAGFTFDYGIFTNIEPDHIGPNEHRDFEHYLECKKMLLKQCRVGIVNRDDEHFEKIIEGATCEIETYGIGESKHLDLCDQDIRAEDMELVSRPGYLGIKYDVKGLMDFPVEIDIPGKFSVYNSMTAIAICRHFGVEPEAIVEALKDIKVKGRIELIKVSDDFTLMIDYAHNAMALESLLTTLREYKPHRLVSLFGCGGNRARDRRFEMGEVSGKLADLTIITSDNPRNEDPQAIIDDIKTGISKTTGKYVEIINRKDAIKYAIEHGEPGDIIICAGKGHETYQEINGVKYDMDERVLIKEILEELRENK